jgi:FkbM family methyltransferase
MLAKRGLHGITGNIYTGLHEFEEMSFLLHLLRETDCFFDIGANVGSYTILAAGVCAAKTYSFEPVPATFRILAANVRLNQLTKGARLINAAVGSDETTLRFTSRQDATNHVIAQTETDEDGIMVPVVKIDDYRAAVPLLLKIDVEGFETEVLRGAKQLLEQESMKAIIIELNGSGKRYNFNEDLIHQQLTNLGFTPYHYEPFSRTLTRLNSYGHSNTLYLRDLPFIRKRINSAKKFQMFSESI